MRVGRRKKKFKRFTANDKRQTVLILWCLTALELLRKADKFMALFFGFTKAKEQLSRKPFLPAEAWKGAGGSHSSLPVGFLEGGGCFEPQSFAHLLVDLGIFVDAGKEI